MSGGVYVFEDNTDEICKKLSKAYLQGLEAVGLAAEGYAKQEITGVGAVDTGRLRNSITHKISSGEKAVYIGTAVEYGKYVECGTGRQSSVGGNPLINGMRPRPFLKPAATQHTETYNKIMQDALKNG